METADTYTWVRLNVLGDGNCFYRSLYGAAKYHTDPAVLDDLLACLGLGRANLNAPAPRRFTLRRSKGGANPEQAREDAMCRKARSAIANTVRADDGAFLDTLGDESPYAGLVNLKNMLIQMQFDNPAEIMNALYDELAEDGTATSAEVLDATKLMYLSYFKPSTAPEILERLVSQAIKTFRLYLTGESATENTGFIQPAQYLRDDLTAEEFPDALHDTFQESWEAFIGEMSAGFQTEFADFTEFPKSRGEFAAKYAKILEKYGEFATEIDVTVLNKILAPCNLIVHVLSTTAPKRVENPAGFRPLYVLLDAEGEHYNYIISASAYPTHPNSENPEIMEQKYYSDAELFTADSVGIYGTAEPEVPRPKPENTNTGSQASTNNINARVRNTLNSLGIKENSFEYKNMYAALKESMAGGKRRVTRKKRRT